MLATSLLCCDRAWNTSNTNKGGWANSSLNTMLNTRLYAAIPKQIRAIIKQVEVPSSIGSQSNDISTSACYITVPAVIEVDPNMTVEPYVNEGKSISYMVNNTSRMRAYSNGTYGRYWLRSPNVTSDSWVYRVNADGSTYGFTTPSYSAGILIEISL
jgi:hypothetical protein